MQLVNIELFYSSGKEYKYKWFKPATNKTQSKKILIHKQCRLRRCRRVCLKLPSLSVERDELLHPYIIDTSSSLTSNRNENYRSHSFVSPRGNLKKPISLSSRVYPVK